MVKSYFDWLSEPEYETPVCGICKGELHAENMVRFLCLGMLKANWRETMKENEKKWVEGNYMIS